MLPRPVPLVFPLVMCMLLTSTAVVMTQEKLALTADGSYFLVRIISDETLFGPPGRIFAEAVRQLPVLALIWGGETNTETLSIAHGLGQLILPALVWCAAIIVARRDPVVFFAVAGTAALCAGGTWLFSVSEGILAVPLTVLLAVLLWLPRWGLAHALLALTCSLVLVSTYETAALIGIAFAGWGVVRARATERRLERYACWLVAASSCVSVVVAVVGASGQGPGPSHARWFLFYLVSLEPWPFYLAFAGLSLVVAGLELDPPRRVSRALLAPGGVLVGLGALATETTVSAAYEARAGAAGVSFALVLYLWWRWGSRPEGWEPAPSAPPAWVTVTPIVLAAITAILVLDAAQEWERDLKVFRSTVTSRSGILIADEALPRDRSGALWDWTSLYLSLVVRRRPDDAILVDREPSYVSYTVEEARRRLPDGFAWR